MEKVKRVLFEAEAEVDGTTDQGLQPKKVKLSDKPEVSGIVAKQPEKQDTMNANLEDLEILQNAVLKEEPLILIADAHDSIYESTMKSFQKIVGKENLDSPAVFLAEFHNVGNCLFTQFQQVSVVRDVNSKKLIVSCKKLVPKIADLPKEPYSISQVDKLFFTGDMYVWEGSSPMNRSATFYKLKFIPTNFNPDCGYHKAINVVIGPKTPLLIYELIYNEETKEYVKKAQRISDVQVLKSPDWTVKFNDVWICGNLNIGSDKEDQYISLFPSFVVLGGSSIK